MKLDFKHIMLVLALSYGLLWILKLIGVLAIITGWIAGYWPSSMEVPIGDLKLSESIVLAIPPLSGLLAIIVVAVLATLLANSLVIGIKDKDFLPSMAIIALVSVVLWVALPQILPTVLQPAAGAAQAMFSGGAPMALLVP